jgi:acetyltransferase-like isoleucine patch superfamily enzyme
MKFANIKLGVDVEIDPSSTINNVIIGDRVKIAKRCSIYGGPDNQLELGSNSYVGMNTILNGFRAKLIIEEDVSIAQNVNVMVDSGPNASPSMQKVFPIEEGPVYIANNCWLGANVIVMPNVSLGRYCIVAANSFVNKSFPEFSIIGGNPARLIRYFTDDEKEMILGK